MREFICAVCGTKAIDNSTTQNKKFCSKSCQWKYHEHKRDKCVETECKYNSGVLCGNPQCENCGWNPVVEKARMSKWIIWQEI